jgi:hypothetical protein
MEPPSKCVTRSRAELRLPFHQRLVDTATAGGHRRQSAPRHMLQPPLPIQSACSAAGSGARSLAVVRVAGAAPPCCRQGATRLHASQLQIGIHHSPSVRTKESKKQIKRQRRLRQGNTLEAEQRRVLASQLWPVWALAIACVYVQQHKLLHRLQVLPATNYRVCAEAQAGERRER